MRRKSPRPRPPSAGRAYGTDLAYIHHVGFSDLSRAAGRWIVAALREAGWSSGRVVDLGCGSGELAAGVSGAGYDVLGVDASRAMIARARRTAPSARFRVASLFTTPLPSSVGVTIVGEGLNYAVRGNPRLERLFRRVHRALQPGGLFVFDVIVSPGARSMMPASHHRMGEDWAVVATTTPVAGRPGRARRHIVAFRRVGRRYRRSEETHALQFWSRDTLLDTLRKLDFRVRTMRAYGAVRLPAGRTVFVARKPPIE